MSTTVQAPRATTRTIDQQATILLALAAMRDQAIDPTDFDFIESAPDRAHEVAEFNAWIAGGAA